MSLSPNLGLPYIIAAQAQKHVTHNEAIRALDALVQLSALTRALATPPTSPIDGARYLVAASPTGAWAGHANHLAAWQDGAWAFFAPQTGWLAWIADEAKIYAFNGTAWAVPSGGGITSVNPTPLVGVNATADTTNRLSVASPATLFNHEGAGHQIKINKAASANTASVLFQDAFSGRAEFGLTGDDNWRVKVSADGTVWKDAIVADRTTGRVSFPAGGVVQTTTASIIASVPSQYATIQAALNALLVWRFEGAAQGIVEIATGTYALTTPFLVAHPQRSRIVVRAAVAATVPVVADFTGTKATDEAMIRAKYKVILECPGVNGITLSNGEGCTLQDIALIRTGTSGAPVGAALAAGAALTLTRCAVFGFVMGINAITALVAAISSQIAYSSSPQGLFQSASVFAGNTVLVMYGANHGLLGIENSVLSVNFCVAKGNAVSGYYADSASVIRGSNSQSLNNSAFGVQCAALGSAMLLGWTFAANASGAFYQADGCRTYVLSATVTGGGLFQSWNGSHLSQVGTHTGAPTFSPASGTLGNANSFTT